MDAILFAIYLTSFIIALCAIGAIADIYDRLFR